MEPPFSIDGDKVIYFFFENGGSTSSSSGLSSSHKRSKVVTFFTQYTNLVSMTYPIPCSRSSGV